MQTGAGIQNKILEAMALGTINIISSLAASPINAKHQHDYLVIDDPESISKEINMIHTSSKEYDYIKLNSRQYIKNTFTWDIFEKSYIKCIEETIK